MSSLQNAAATLPSKTRIQLAIRTMTRSEPVSRIAAQENVSRKYLYCQKQKAETALDKAFSPVDDASDVLFTLPVTRAWLHQLVLSLALTCHSSYRGIIQLLIDMFDTSASLGDIHNQLQAAAKQAAAINKTQELSSIQVGLHDEIFQGNKPILVGIDAASTYCYLLAEAQHRDEVTWGVHLLDAKAQGLNPDYTIADAAKGLRSGQRAVFGELPCHGDVFHIQHQCETLANLLTRLAKGATSRRQQPEQRITAFS